MTGRQRIVGRSDWQRLECFSRFGERRNVSSDQPIEELIQKVVTLDRDACKAELRRFRNPHIDFTDEYLDQQPLERLRHFVMAACMQARKAQREESTR